MIGTGGDRLLSEEHCTAAVVVAHRSSAGVGLRNLAGRTLEEAHSLHVRALASEEEGHLLESTDNAVRYALDTPFEMCL